MFMPIKVFSLFCSTASTTFQVKPLSQDVIDDLVKLKKINGVSNFQESWVMHKSIKDPRKLGRFLKKLQTNPDLVTDYNQFEIISGNHTFRANSKIEEENSNASSAFKKLRCKFFVCADPQDKKDVEDMRLVGVLQKQDVERSIIFRKCFYEIRFCFADWKVRESDEFQRHSTVRCLGAHRQTLDGECSKFVGVHM